MSVRQTRIFVRSAEPNEDWSETLIGKVLRPIATEFAAHLDWFWFSRYSCSVNIDSGDCDIASIRDEFKQPMQPEGPPWHRSMRFRFNIADDQTASFEGRATDLIEANGYQISDFRPYDFVGDTGSNRFLGIENREPGRAEQRAILTTRFYCATAHLIMDAIVGPDQQGRFRSERNDDPNNPAGSTFQSPLHLFCNMTAVPTDVYVFRKGNADAIGISVNPYAPPPAPPEGWDQEILQTRISF